MAATVAGILLTGNHASRPSSGVSVGTLYSCTTHSKIYQTSDTGSTWADWATLGTSGAYSPGGTDVALADGGTGASLVDPNADRILFWDDSAGGVTWLEAGTGLSISGTTISASGSSLWTLIADTTHGSDTASFDFTSIANSYKHLCVIVQGRSNRASNTTDFVKATFNGDTGNNYDYCFWNFSTGTSFASSPVNEGYAQASLVRVMLTPAANSTAGDVANAVLWIPDYKSTALVKSVHMTGGAMTARSAGGAFTFHGFGSWRSTAAITQVTLTMTNGSWLTGSRASLYGIS